jgi:UDP:flavonoid glycosyltransferase YjiC (YdhE family)
VRLRKLTPGILAAALEELASDRSFELAASDVKEKMLLEDGTGLAVDLIEETIAGYPGNPYAGAELVGEAS